MDPVSIEAAYDEACMALGEAVVQKRFITRALEQAEAERERAFAQITQQHDEIVALKKQAEPAANEDDQPVT